VTGRRWRDDGEWPKDVVERRSCPWPYCDKLVEVYSHAPSSDRLDERVNTTMQHEIVGANSWFQRICPGSNLLIPLSERGKLHLFETNERFRAALVDRLNSTEAGQEAARNLATLNEVIKERRRLGTLGHLDRPGEEYFPPRPSDVEDAQAEYEPGTAPEGVELIAHIRRRRGQVKGESNMTSANENTLNLIALAKLAVSSAQEECSRASNAVNLVDSIISSVDEHLVAAGQLMGAAAGGSSVTPQLAAEALLNLTNARKKCEETTANLAGAITHIDSTFAASQHVIEKLGEFVEQLSR
jgi:hypothetical protein